MLGSADRNYGFVRAQAEHISSWCRQSSYAAKTFHSSTFFFLLERRRLRKEFSCDQQENQQD